MGDLKSQYRCISINYIWGDLKSQYRCISINYILGFKISVSVLKSCYYDTLVKELLSYCKQEPVVIFLVTLLVASCYIVLRCIFRWMPTNGVYPCPIMKGKRKTFCPQPTFPSEGDRKTVFSLGYFSYLLHYLFIMSGSYR